MELETGNIECSCQILHHTRLARCMLITTLQCTKGWTAVETLSSSLEALPTVRTGVRLLVGADDKEPFSKAFQIVKPVFKT